jgi:uncharacterized protein DUF402
VCVADDPIRFGYGELVYLRHLQRDVVSGVLPFRVVSHDGNGLLLWSTAGSSYWHLNAPGGRRMRETPIAEWVTAHKVPVRRTVRHSVLSWHPAGADYSIRFFYATDGGFTHWYANLELPFVGWRDARLAGLDTVDWDLDVWVDADRSWRWKDEEEFVARLAWPEYYWVDDEQRVRAAGREVVNLVEAGGFPFDGTWCDYLPPDGWGPVTADDLPSGWDRPRAC